MSNMRPMRLMRPIKPILLFLSALLVAGAGIFLYSYFFSSSASAAWWDDGWQYRKAVEIATHTSAENNVYINLTGANDIDTATLISTGKMQSDCGDLRFTTKNGDTLSYYIASGCNSADTVVHVNFDSFPAGAQTIYYYYGNASAPNGFNSADFTTEASSYTFGTLGSEETSEGPSLYYNFDEGQGTTAQDSTANNLDGTLNNTPTWTTEDLCISGKCLYFDGANNENVSRADNTLLDFVAADNFTLSAWVRKSGASSANTVILGKASANIGSTYQGYKLYMDASGDFCFDTQDGTLAVDTACTSAVEFDDDKWHLVQGVKTSTTKLELYIDGNLRASDSSIASTGSLANSGTFYAGVDSDGTTIEWKGFIDDVKVSPYARSAAQIKLDFNTKAASTSKGSGTTIGVNNQDYLSNGLVGYWKTDELSGNAADSSGNGLTLTNNSTMAYAAGKFGNAAQCDGTADYLNTATTISGIQTVSFWAYPAAAANNYFINLINSSAYITINSSGVVSATGFTTPSIYVNGVLNGTVTAAAWNLITVTTTTSINANAFAVGLTNDGSNHFCTNTSKIDEVRIYNRALSPKEISDLYNWAPGPLHYWKFEEGSGTTSLDSGSGGTNGTITGATYSIGKYGKAIKLDAQGDKVNYGNLSTEMSGKQLTWEGWVYNYGSFDSSAQLFSAGTSGANSSYLQFSGTTTPVFAHVVFTTAGAIDTTSADIGSNTWTHVAVTYNGNTLALWLNGVLANSQTVANDSIKYYASQVGEDFNIGSTQLRTKIDDFRVYNYARTQKQIIADMNAGHPNVGSPVGSAVGYWKFDEGYGSTTHDSSQNKFDLTLANSPTWTNSGKFSKALSFASASNQYSYVADNSTLSITGDLTLSSWINPSSVTASTQFDIAGKAQDSTTSYLLAQYGDEIRMYIGSTSNYVTTNAANLTTGTWYHVLAVYNATAQTVKIYVNGRDQATTTTGTIPSSISNNTDNFQIGSSQTVTSTTNTYQISADVDDGTEYNNTTWNQSLGEWAGFGHWTGGINDEHAGFRFLNVNIAKDTTVTSAYLSLYIRAHVDGVTAQIYGDSNATPNAWSSTNRPSQMTKTTAYTNWTPSLSDGTWNNSPDISGVINEILALSGWASGNNLRLAIFNNGSTGDTDDNFWDYSGDTSRATKLVVTVPAATTPYNGVIDEVKVYNYTLTSDEVKTEYNRGSSLVLGALGNLSTLSNQASAQEYCVPGDSTSCAAPVGEWKMEEKTGTSANDTSGNGNTLTLTNSPTFTAGKYGAGVNFAGSNAHLIRADDSDFDFAAGGSFTLEAWIKHNAASAQEIILSKFNEAGYKLLMENDGDITCGIDYDSTWTPTDSVTSTAATYDDNRWHYLSCVKNANTSLTLYIDGVSVGTPDTSLTNSTLANTDPLYVGIDADATSNDWIGQIDEVKIFNYARSAAQVAYDYNRGAPVGWWKFDECQGTQAHDSSGNSNTGTITPGSGGQTAVGTCTGSAGTLWKDGATGKRNASLDFDGTDDYISVPDPGTGSVLDSTTGDSITLSAWVNPNVLPSAGNYQTIFSKGSTDGTNDSNYKIQIGNVSGNYIVVFCFRGNSVTNCSESSTSVIQTNKWQHLAATFTFGTASSVKLYYNGLLQTSAWTSGDGNNAPSVQNKALWIGGDQYTGGSPTQLVNGQIDDVKVFNYALTGTQVKDIYNGGALFFGPSTGAP